MTAANGVRRRSPNYYGYLYTSAGQKAPWPGTQLQNLLKLDREKFYHVKARNYKHIVNLMKKHMDLHLTGGEQEGKTRVIEKEIMEQFPDIFAEEESERRLYFVTRLVLHLHATRRSAYRKCLHGKHHHDEVATTTDNTNQGKVLRSHNRVMMAPSIPLSQSNGVNRAGRMPESASSISRSNEFSSESNNTTSSTSTTRTIIHDDDDPNQYHDIHTFLGASIPPMIHLMDAFIDFGCINAAFLLAISSWSSEKIRDVLDRLSLAPSDKKVTEMEKFILENHFKEYFAQKENSGL